MLNDFSPTLYVGEHDHGLYAMPSLVDEETLTIAPTSTGPLLLEGPQNFEVPDEIELRGIRNNFAHKNDNADPLGIPLESSNDGKQKSSVLLFGKFSKIDFFCVFTWCSLELTIAILLSDRILSLCHRKWHPVHAVTFISYLTNIFVGAILQSCCKTLLILTIQSSFDITIRDITIILDIMILFSRETEFLLNKNSRYNDIFDRMICCRVTEDIVIVSKLDCIFMLF